MSLEERNDPKKTPDKKHLTSTRIFPVTKVSRAKKKWG